MSKKILMAERRVQLGVIIASAVIAGLGRRSGNGSGGARRARSSRSIFVSIIAGLAFAGLLVASSAGAAGASRLTSSEVSLHSALRKLGEEYIVYIRTFIISALAGLPDADSTAQRLLRNQDDLGAAVKPFYGKEAGAKLASLLREHILIAADIVKSAKAGDGNGVTKGQAAWRANA